MFCWLLDIICGNILSTMVHETIEFHRGEYILLNGQMCLQQVTLHTNILKSWRRPSINTHAHPHIISMICFCFEVPYSSWIIIFQDSYPYFMWPALLNALTMSLGQVLTGWLSLFPLWMKNTETWNLGSKEKIYGVAKASLLIIRCVSKPEQF
jgi:hypothetical protein